MSQQPPKYAVLQYTCDDGPLVDRTWERMDATVTSEQVFAKVPEAATVWCLAVTGQGGAMVTTEVMFRHR